MFKSTNAERAAAVGLIEARLAKLNENETVLLSELAAIGHWNLKADRSPLGEAQRRVSRRGIITEAVRKVGIKRLANEDIPSVGVAARRSIRGKVRRTVLKLEQVNLSSLNNEQKTAALAEQSYMALLAHVSAESAAKRITVATVKSQKRLALDEQLAAME